VAPSDHDGTDPVTGVAASALLDRARTLELPAALCSRHLSDGALAVGSFPPLWRRRKPRLEKLRPIGAAQIGCASPLRRARAARRRSLGITCAQPAS